MDRAEYMQHARRALLAEAMDSIASMSDDEIEAEILDRISSDSTDAKVAFDRALREGMSTSEVDEMLELEIEDPIEEINDPNGDDLDPDELDDQLTAEFIEISSLFLDKMGATLLLGYCYLDPNDDSDPNNVRGRVLVHGDTDSLKVLMRQMRETIKGSQVDGFADNITQQDSGESGSDPDDPLLREISDRL